DDPAHNLGVLKAIAAAWGQLAKWTSFGSFPLRR
ncbi:hypothetical protein AVEN_146973-1, partial [Araneus ventricosus]